MKAYSVKYLIDENNLFARFIFTPKLKKIKSKNYSSIDDAKDSPLVQQMFYLPFVKSVKLTPEYLILERFDILKWEDVIEEVSIELEKFLNEGGKILDTNHSDDKSPITIYAESTPNPEVMKFVSNKILVNNIYEFKCVNKLEQEHFIQLAMYAYMNENNYIHHQMKFNYYLYNILTDEMFMIDVEYEKLKEMMEFIIYKKYFSDSEKVPDEVFIQNMINLI